MTTNKQDPVEGDPIRRALINAQKELKDLWDWQPCDHSVGICSCSTRRALEDIEAALRQPQGSRLTEEGQKDVAWFRDICATAGKGCLPNFVDARASMRVIKIIDRLTAAPAPQVTKLGHPCGDMDCNKDREKKMVRVGTYNSKPVFCDPCIALIVQALNDGGIRTIASCCGHNRRPATIAIEGDMWLTLTDRKGMEKIAAIFPGDINGEERAAQQVTREEIASWYFERESVDGEQFGVDHSLTEDAYEFADTIMSLLASRGLVKGS